VRLNFPFRRRGLPWNDLRKIFRGCQWTAKVANGEEKLPKISNGWVECTNVTDRRQTTDRQTEGTAIAENFACRPWLIILPEAEIRVPGYPIYYQTGTRLKRASSPITVGRDSWRRKVTWELVDILCRSFFIWQNYYEICAPFNSWRRDRILCIRLSWYLLSFALLLGCWRVVSVVLALFA